MIKGGDNIRPKSPRRGRPALGSKRARKTNVARLRVATDRVPVTDFLSYRDYLAKLYAELKRDNPSYSYAQLGEDLGFSRSNVLWLVITGRRKLTLKAIVRVVSALSLTGTDRKYLETLQRYGSVRRPDEREQVLRDLVELKTKTVTSEAGKKALEYFSEWQHPVLREMIGLREFVAESNWINARLVLKLTPMEIRRSLELLERLALITYDRKRGRYVQTGGQVLPDRDVERLASVRFHQKMCDIARETVTRVPAARREMNTMTLCVSDEIAMQAGAILHKACEQIMKLEAETKSREQVYQVNVHLFPFTKFPGG